MTQSIPFALCPHSFGFETRLAEPEAAVAFALCVDESGRDFFAQMDEQDTVAAGLLCDPWWQIIRELNRQ